MPIDMKVSRYGWNDDLGQRGKYRSMHKDGLDIDKSYQRGASDGKIRFLAHYFSWLFFGTVIVSSREDGTLMVIDGWHRIQACRLRTDIDFVPCIVYEGLTVQEEAKIFERVNRARRQLRSVELFKALVTSDDPAAKDAQRILGSYGFRVSGEKDPKVVRAAMTVYDMAAKGTLENVLSFLVRAWPESELHNRSQSLSGADRFLKALQRAKKPIVAAPLIAKMGKKPLESIHKRGAAVRELLSTSYSEGIFRAMAEVYNARMVGDRRIKTNGTA